MVEIKDLLNPLTEECQDLSMPETPRSRSPMEDCSTGQSTKKVKLTKDAPVFARGPIRGECRFPPDEYQDEGLAAYHQQFEVFPMGEIADYPRHIPYNSEKKLFLEKTGREHFEVFQYNFKKPGDEQVYSVLWDYNIGLVRTTPLFKCMGHSKTTPAKMLGRNPGLKDICHSITGGALVAQGYWIPHAAAKAIAATFCYDVRHALTPVFGHDFPGICIKPGEEGFGDMKIDPAITDFCAKQAAEFKANEFETDTPTPTSSSISTPTRRRRNVKKCGSKPFVNTYISPYLASPFASDMSDSGSEDSSIVSSPTPGSSFRSAFTPINTPRVPPRSVPYTQRRLPSPREILAQGSWPVHNTVELLSPPITNSRASSPTMSPRTVSTTRISPQQDDANSYECASASDKLQLDPSLLSCIPEEDTAAVYILLSMKLQKTPEQVARGLGLTLKSCDVHNNLKRSSSA